jgi:NAD(P)H-flavin reductase
LHVILPRTVRMQRVMSLPESHKIETSSITLSIAVSGKVIREVDMQEGDTVEMKGPLPKFPYKANMKKKIGMVDTFTLDV